MFLDMRLSFFGSPPKSATYRKPTPVQFMVDLSYFLPLR